MGKYCDFCTSILHADGSNNRGWNKVSTGLYWLSDAIYWPVYLSPAIIAVKSDLTNYKIKVRTAKEFGRKLITAQEVARRTGSIFVINGSFFDQTEKPLGLVVSRGNLLSPLHRGGTTLTGIFQIKNNRPQIIHRDAYNPTGVIEAIQAGPRLLVNGAKTPVNKDQSRSFRTSICVNDHEEVIFASSTRWIIGITLKEMQTMLKKLGCKEALNLDGGGSAQFVYTPPDNQISQRKELVGKDQVPIVIELSN
jgi:exopolysaccharide biosynthesis protein